EIPFSEVKPNVKKLRIDPALRAGPQEKPPEAAPRSPTPAHQAPQNEEAEFALEPTQEMIPDLHLHLPQVEPEAVAEIGLEVEPVQPAGGLDFGAEPAQSRSGSSREFTPSPEQMNSMPDYSIQDNTGPVRDEPPGLSSAHLFDEPVYDEPVQAPVAGRQPGRAPMPTAATAGGEPAAAVNQGGASSSVDKLSETFQKAGGILAGILLLGGGVATLAAGMPDPALGVIFVLFPMLTGLVALVLPFLPLNKLLRAGGFGLLGAIALVSFFGAIAVGMTGIIGPFVQFVGAMTALFAASLSLLTRLIK
ncbi:MAG: hypothetical protein ACNA8W_21420, partial [Bradymonadaceae bacterium]